MSDTFAPDRLLSGLGIVDWERAEDAERLRVLSRGRGRAGMYGDEQLRTAIRGIVDDVVARGDVALTEALRRFDGISLPADRLRIGEAEFAAARAGLDPEVVAAIQLAVRRCRAFNQQIRDRQDWTERTREGVLVGERVAPIPSAGLFVPSGKGSFPSVAIQIGAPAVVAGVPRIAVALPPLPGGDGAVDPATLVALEELGLREVYRGNGPALIAALAAGTDTVARVAKIVGPGSPAVAYAQLETQRLGCAIELGFGPTDSLIVADHTADARLAAADLLNEAEHGHDSSAVLVSTDRGLLERVLVEVREQITALPQPRAGYAASSIEANGGLVHVPDRAAAMRLADDYAPEHLQLAVADPEDWLADSHHAGTALLGQWTTFAASNYVIGTPATLPTTGFAQVSSGVTANTFLTRTSIAQLDEEEFWGIAPAYFRLAEHEGFPAHAATVTARRPR